jgi:hypothetical protein
MAASQRAGHLPRGVRNHRPIGAFLLVAVWQLASEDVAVALEVRPFGEDRFVRVQEHAIRHQAAIERQQYRSAGEQQDQRGEREGRERMQSSNHLNRSRTGLRAARA